jgi:gliding motility-associated-like protein
MYQKLDRSFPLYIFLFIITQSCWSQNIAPTLTATGNQPYCPLSQINIVTDFDIVDPDDTGVDALYIQISTGYVAGVDTLVLTGSHPNVITSWNASEGKLSLIGIVSGPVNYTDLIVALKGVVFQSSSNNPSDKSFSITIGDANYLPFTGHYYEYVSAIGITWNNAKIAAEARTYFGIFGYLATITSAEEAQLSGEQAAGAGWVGGSDTAVEGVWRWVTGPENGTVFWNGGINGTTPNYANWNNSEPNNSRNEDYAHVTAPGIGLPGSWNDLSNTGDPSGNYQPKGYIVEYGGMPGDPILTISASTSVYTITIDNTVNDSRCGNGTLTLSATSTAGGDILWFENATGGTPIGVGNSFSTSLINTTTTYYALASVNGCVEGTRFPVVATVKPIPVITTSTGDLVCESNSGTLLATVSGGTINWYASSTGGALLATGTSFTTPVLTNTTDYYVDATLNGCTTLSRTPVTLTVQNTPLPIGDSTQHFCNINQATLSNIVITGNGILWYASSSGGSALNSSDLLVDKTTYYASQTINDCESVTRLPITIQVSETVVVPQSSEIPNLFECDTDIDGDDINGFSTFDLTQNEVILLNGKSSSDFTFSYYTDAGYSALISTPSNAFINTTKDAQTIYVRIVNNVDNTCYTDVLFNLKVDELPVIKPSVLFKNCDEDGVSDGFTDFNLEEINNIVTNNNSADFVVTYHMSSADANFAMGVISTFPFNNATASTVFARVESVSGCYRVSTIDLQVSTTSFPPGFSPLELEKCDDDLDVDGYHVFDISQTEAYFLNQFPLGQNLSVHFYSNIFDAQLEQNEIIQKTNFINENPFNQTLYVRVESTDNGGCFGIGPYLTLKVHPIPEFEVDNSSIYCLDNNPITLTTFNPQGNYTYEWKDNNGIVVSDLPIATVVSGGKYTVVANSSFSCASIPIEFNVVESARAIIDNNDILIIGLSDNNSITIKNENNNLGIGDYEFAIDNEFGFYQDQSFFKPVTAGIHTIHVRDKNGCGVDSIEVFVLGFPKFFTPNNDANNDAWQLKGLNNEIGKATVFIYDRYGKLMKQLDPRGEGWNGIFNGSKLPTSDYWFVAELVDLNGLPKIYRGHFSLIR